MLAVDPSSQKSSGSIMADKTRMKRLAVHPNAFIRPSPSRSFLGGAAEKSHETLLVCEASGYDVIIIETVGSGQSETEVASMVDFFLVLMLPGAGDELQRFFDKSERLIWQFCMILADVLIKVHVSFSSDLMR